MGVAEEGRCAADGQLEYCVVPTDVDEDESHAVEVVRTACGTGERCAVTDGYAECAPQGNAAPATPPARPTRAAALTDGRWASEPCATECIDTGLGAAGCPPLAGSGQPPHAAGAVFDAREPNEGRTDWATETVTRNAEGFQVVAIAGWSASTRGAPARATMRGSVELALLSEASTTCGWW
ncbi:MAG: hypothetical protein IPF99_30985 [Deltaproteobacteria bacterium]|nr:hypothetical protein [Deltaproteobacteria bacterium]